MKNSVAILCSAMILVASVILFASRTVKAQSGAVNFLGANSGTTLALNCPTIPATPSICVVGDGVWLWQSATLGWYKPSAGVAATGVTSWNGQTGAVVYSPPVQPLPPVTSVNGKTGAVVLAIQ